MSANNSEGDYNSTGGYARLGSYMGEIPEQAIFRRFAGLNSRNILYLQAELIFLEKQLNKYADEDEKSFSSNRNFYDRDWVNLQLSSQLPPPDDNDRQWKTFLKIREKLKEYSKTSTF